MEAILKFTLPEDEEEHMDAINGTSYRAIISDLLERLRQDLKYKDLPPPVYDYAEQLRDYIIGQLTDSNLPR